MYGVVRVKGGVVLEKRRAHSMPANPGAVEFHEVTEEQYAALGPCYHEDSGPPRWRYTGGAFLPLADARPTLRFSADNGTLKPLRRGLGIQRFVGDPDVVIGVGVLNHLGQIDETITKQVSADAGGRRVVLNFESGVAKVRVPCTHPRVIQWNSNHEFRVETPLRIEIMLESKLGDSDL